jgi:TonB family protein
MQPSDLSTKHRSIANQQSSKILAAGLGGSILLHFGLIAGISHLWQSAVKIDDPDPLEITLVEPVNIPIPLAPVVRSTAKLTPPPKITPVKSTAIKSIAKSISPSTPNFTLPLPKPIDTKSSRPKSKSQGLQSVLTPIPLPKTSSKPKPKTNSIDRPPIPIPIPTPAFNPPFPSEPKPVPPPPDLAKNVRSSVTSVKPPAANLSNVTPPNRSQIGAGSGGNPIGNPAPNPPPGNPQISGSSTSPPTGSGGNPTPNMPPGDSAKSDSGITKLECIKYCEIPKLRDLQDTDSGKDRLRIRIVINAKGVIVDASIAKSSGNPQLDATVLAGIKQMQFTPSGKEISGIVKANILIRSANSALILSIA